MDLVTPFYRRLSALPPSLFEETISLPYFFDTLMNAQIAAVE